MSDASLSRANCPNCDKRIGVRPDQFGRRLRCPTCKMSFVIERPVEGGPTVVTADYGQPQPDPEPLSPAADAYEVVRSAPPDTPPPPPHRGFEPREWAKAKLTARFSPSRDLVFQSFTQAVRAVRCDVLAVEQADYHLRFSIVLPGVGASEHDLFVFVAAGGACEVDIASRDPNEEGRFDPLYEAVVREAEKYLMFAPASGATGAPAGQPTTPVEPPPRRRRYADDDYDAPPRRRRSGAGDGITVPLLISAISNIVVGLIWAATCFGIIFAIPMFILCVFEFMLWSKADRMSGRRLAGEARSLAIFEIIVGLANLGSLIAGIIILINSGNELDRDN